jgi:hypothetical protein
MGVDRRGHERGKCTLCDCTEFEEGDGLACGYCGDPPAKHVLILDVNGNAVKPLPEQETHGMEYTDKTSSNCLRLIYVDRKKNPHIIYVKRDFILKQASIPVSFSLICRN